MSEQNESKGRKKGPSGISVGDGTSVVERNPPAVQDKELYQHILGLTSPWTVSEVKLDMAAQEIQVRVEQPTGTKFCCPECPKELSFYDHGEERRWRHLDSCQFKTILIGRVPRVECPEHGVKSVSVPWALPHSRFTIMFERFAIEVMLMTQTVKGAVDKVRRTEHRRLLKEGDDSLKGSKYFWLTSPEHHSEKQHARFQSICNLSLATGRAWSYKELLRDLWTQETAGKAKSYFGDWYQRVIRTKMAPMKKLARSLRERIDNIVTYCTHGITNAVAEVINSKIMSIKRRAGGYRNIENFKTAVMFYCGGLDLYPR